MLRLTLHLLMDDGFQITYHIFGYTCSSTVRLFQVNIIGVIKPVSPFATPTQLQHSN